MSIIIILKRLSSSSLKSVSTMLYYDDGSSQGLTWLLDQLQVPFSTIKYYNIFFLLSMKFTYKSKREFLKYQSRFLNYIWKASWWRNVSTQVAASARGPKAEWQEPGLPTRGTGLGWPPSRPSASSSTAAGPWSRTGMCSLLRIALGGKIFKRTLELIVSVS